MDSFLQSKFVEVGKLLLDQENAEVLVEPRRHEDGFWFGGGNICEGQNGDLWLVGRYRNGGDSRTGVEAGPRGAELLLMHSEDGGRNFEPAFSWKKQDLAPAGDKVLSIEGAALSRKGEGVELYVSSEKDRVYPETVRGAQKGGTGVWSIDVLRAGSMNELAHAPVEPVLGSDNPVWLHVKDPVIFQDGGRRILIYCSHPYCWSSSNTGYAVEVPGNDHWDNASWCLKSRGPCWDVAAFRITDRLALPPVGVLESGRFSMYFYDGAECIHDHGGDPPTGYSCEEVGGLVVGHDEEFPHLERISVKRPLFLSPYGRGTSRYVSVFDAGDRYIATWQQSRPDLSQPLVVNEVPRESVEKVLQS